eukprot:321782-Prorocentrum_minimum.AAC.1
MALYPLAPNFKMGLNRTGQWEREVVPRRAQPKVPEGPHWPEFDGAQITKGASQRSNIRAMGVEGTTSKQLDSFV